MKHITFLLALALVFVFSACNNNRIAELEKENAQLKDQISSAKTGVRNLNEVNLVIDSPEAEEYTQNFRNNANPINIPLSWRFDSADLLTLSSNYAYVRFYSAIETGKNELKIIAVGVNAQNEDQITRVNEAGAVVSAMYNFAQTCPTSACAANSTILYNQTFPQVHTYHK